MSFTLYDISIPPVIRGLQTLSSLLEKAQKDVPNDKSTADLISARLIADMAALPFQVQRVSDTAKGLAVRVGHAKPVAMADTETTFPELQARIAQTIAILEALDPNCMDGMEAKEVVLPWPKRELKFTGRSYVQDYALPNFYFHLCMAYAILRKEGVPVGKIDYLRPN